MSFVHPGFLWFLSLLAIPIILHLFHLRRFKRFYFPSLKYLKEQEQEKKSVKKLKRLLILCARLLAITAFVLAFAQPFFKSSDKPANGIPVTAIYIDNSLSMSSKGTEGELLSEVRESAKKIVLKSAGNTRFLITTNSFSGVERKMHSKATAIQYLDEIDYNKTSRTINEVLKWQDEYLARYHREQTSIAKIYRVLLSDFQKSTAIITPYQKPKQPFQEKTILFQCLPQRSENLYVDSVWMESPVHKPGQQCKLSIRIKNAGSTDQEDVSITVNFGGKNRMTNVSVKANSSAETYLLFTPTEPGYIEGKVNVDDRNLSFDDDFYFVNTIASQGKVVIINGEQAEGSAAKVFMTEPYYTFTECSEYSFNKRLLGDADVVFLNGLTDIASGLRTDLTDFIQHGGSVFCMPGKDINTPSYNLLLKEFGLSGFTGKTDNGNQISEISYESIFFKGMFEKQQKSLNIPLFKQVYSLRNFRQANAEVLLRLRNNLPLFLSVKQNGTFYLFTADISKSNSGFTTNALFPSILLRTAELSLRALPYYLTIGKQGVIEIPSNTNQDQPLSLVAQNESFIPKQMYENGMVRIQLNQPELNERISEGFYAIKSDKILGKLALNLNRQESETSLTDMNELTLAFQEAGFDAVQSNIMKNGHSSFDVEFEKPNSFWRIFVLLACCFLLVEMAILKFWK